MKKQIPLLLLILLASCDPPVQQEKSSQGSDPLKEQFVQTNRYLHQRNQDQIAAFAHRLGWETLTTASGLWIVVEQTGNGEPIRVNDRVSYSFSSSLLDGTPCYESQEGRPKQLIVGKGEVERGVEEGLLHLCPGSKAILLIPPHLAFGNFGDRNKIPGNSVLIYRLVIKEVKRA